jgi:hypothetical protein
VRGFLRHEVIAVSSVSLRGPDCGKSFRLGRHESLAHGRARLPPSLASSIGPAGASPSQFANAART